MSSTISLNHLEKKQQHIKELVNKSKVLITGNEDKIKLLNMILSEQEELTIYINKCVKATIAIKEGAMSFDLSYLAPDRLCFDMRWYIQSFLPFEKCIGKNYYHYNCRVMILDDFNKSFNIFSNWNTNIKRLFLINNIVRPAEQQKLYNWEYLKYWVMKKSNKDLDDILYWYRGCEKMRKSMDYMEVRNKYGLMKAKMPKLKLRDIAGRIVYVNKKVGITLTPMKVQKRMKVLIDNIKKEWNETKYMDLVIS